MNSEVTVIWAVFHQELKAFILKKTKNIADTDDILQEVFIKVMRNIDKVNHAQNLRQYLYGIVRNTVNDYFKRIQFTQYDHNIPDSFTEEEKQSLNETISNCCLKPFINKLPEIYRTALIASEFENTSQKDLAQMLNISYSGAKSRVQRGKEKLKELILNCCAYQVDSYGNLIGEENKNCNNCS